MTRSQRALKRVWCAAGIVAALGSGAAAARPNVVLSADFSSPEDVDDWTFVLDTGTTPGGGIQWSATEGQPPGSLELANPGGGPSGVFAYSICLPFGGDQPWTARVDAMPLDPVICVVDLVNQFTPDCSDPPGSTSAMDANGLQGAWHTLEVERGLISDPVDSTRAIRLELATGNVNEEPGSCVFDNIVITGSTAPAAVPAQRPALLAVLAGAIVVIALLSLRSR